MDTMAANRCIQIIMRICSMHGTRYQFVKDRARNGPAHTSSKIKQRTNERKRQWN